MSWIETPTAEVCDPVPSSVVPVIVFQPPLPYRGPAPVGNVIDCDGAVVSAVSVMPVCVLASPALSCDWPTFVGFALFVELSHV